MAEYKEDYLTVNDIKLHYYRAGEGKRTIVLLHGATDNGMCWKPVSDALAEKYEVIMPDAQGHGLSDRLTPGFSFADHADQVAGLIKALDIEKPVLMGHSMGGSTTANVAGLYPDLPGGIILEDPGWMEPAPEGERPPAPSNDFARESMEMTKKSVEELVEICRKQNPRWPEAELVPWAESKRQYDTNLFSYMQINRPTYSEMITKITCPALLITSETGIVSDRVVDKAVEIWTADIPLQHIKIMGAGHNIRREQFDAFYSAVTGFIESL
ncbi:MAG: alpha/beta hydrolase [Dehalococcoidales bacterium]|nr:alpha/beta hydrolase [Dehalococcoidales bacterium]